MSNLRVDELESLATGRKVSVDKIDTEVRQDLANPDKGAGMVGGSIQVVSSISELRSLLKISPSSKAQSTGYYTPGDGGGGFYWLDDSDTTSADNGGSVIVANDGGRWKLVMSGAVDVRQFGAMPDDAMGGGADSYLSIQAAIDFAITNRIGEVYAPGFYMITNTLVIDTGNYSQGLILRGNGNMSRIRQTGEDKDAIWFSTTRFLRNSSLRDMTIYCEPNAGHGVNIKYGCTVCSFNNLNIHVLNPTKSIYIGNWSMFAVGEDHGVFDTVWQGGDYYITQGHTAYGIDFLCKGTTFNENTFSNLRLNNTGSASFFRAINLHDSSYLVNNKLTNINFEVCKAGGLVVYNAKGWTIENISFWDCPLYVNHLILFASNGGLKSITNTLINVSRNGDVLGTQARDIFLEYADATTLINCYTSADNVPSYDWAHNVVYIIGPRLAGELNTAGRVYLDPQSASNTYAVFTGLNANPTRAENFLSITRQSLGVYRLTFIAARPDKTYRVHATMSYGTPGWVQTIKELAYVDIVCINSAGAAFDPTEIDVTVFG